MVPDYFDHGFLEVLASDVLHVGLQRLQEVHFFLRLLPPSLSRGWLSSAGF